MPFFSGRKILHDEIYYMRLEGNAEKPVWESIMFDITGFLRFLAIYEDYGVPLRELVHLASTRYPGILGSADHREWAPPVYEANDKRLKTLVNTKPFRLHFLEVFSLLARDHSTIMDLERRLVSGDFLEVSDRDHQSSTAIYKYDSRIWKLGKPHKFIGNMPSSSWTDNFWPTVLQVFVSMPHISFDYLTDRERSVYYDHAHIILVYIFCQTKRSLIKLTRSCQKELWSLLLKVLTHGFWHIDLDLLKKATGVLPSLAPYSHEWVLLKLVEVKSIAYSQITRPLKETEIRDLIKILDEIQKLSQSSPTNAVMDVSGHVVIQTDNLRRSCGDALLSHKTRETAQLLYRNVSKSSIVSSTAHLLVKSCLLIKFETWDALDKNMPHDTQLNCAFFLLGQGEFLRAEHYFRSGLDATALRSSTMRWWCEIKLISTIMSQSRWEEGVTMLRDLSSEFERDEVDTRETSTNHSELRLANSDLKAYYLTWTEQFDEAQVVIKKLVEDTKNMRDLSTRMIRIYAKRSLLDIQRHFPLPGSIIDIAESLWQEVETADIFEVEPIEVRRIMETLLVSANLLVTTDCLWEAESLIAIICNSKLRVPRHVLAASGSKFNKELKSVNERLQHKHELKQSVIPPITSEDQNHPPSPGAPSLQDEPKMSITATRSSTGSSGPLLNKVECQEESPGKRRNSSQPLILRRFSTVGCFANSLKSQIFTKLAKAPNTDGYEK